MRISDWSSVVCSSDLYEAARARHQLEVARLQLQVNGAAGEAGLLQAARHLLAERPELFQELGGGGNVVLEGGFGGDALGRFVRVHVARVLAAGEAVEALADAAVARPQLHFLQRQQVAPQGCTVARQGRAERLSNEIRN